MGMGTWRNGGSKASLRTERRGPPEFFDDGAADPAGGGRGGSGAAECQAGRDGGQEARGETHGRKGLGRVPGRSLSWSGWPRAWAWL